MNSTVAATTKPSNTNNKIKHSTGENVGTFLIYLVVALFALICVLPFVLVIIVSFSSEKSITINGYSFWPSEWYSVLFALMGIKIFTKKDIEKKLESNHRIFIFLPSFIHL